MHRIITGSAAAAAALAIAAGTGAAANTLPSSPLLGDATQLTADVGHDSAHALADSRAAAQEAVTQLRADFRATISRARAQVNGVRTSVRSTVRRAHSTVDGTVRTTRSTVDTSVRNVRTKVDGTARSLTLTAFAAVDSAGRVVAAPGVAAVTSGPLGAWIVTWKTSLRGCTQVAMANSLTGGTLRVSRVSPAGVTVLGRGVTEALDGSGFTVAAFC